MTHENSIPRTFSSFVLVAGLGFFALAPAAQADPLTVTLTDLTFVTAAGSELFSGSFLYDPALQALSSLNINASGATDFLGSPVAFDAVDSTGSEPFAFQFDDFQGDFLQLTLPLGSNAANYGPEDAHLFGFGLLGSLEGAAFDELASAGSITVSTPTELAEPTSGALLLTGLAIAICVGFKRRRPGPWASRA